eukprot:m.213374 g.213374  ORF g.213374 m.213374 type:complete len:60 (+) comp15083_c2_seq6:5929-6108(+)
MYAVVTFAASVLPALVLVSMLLSKVPTICACCNFTERVCQIFGLILSFYVVNLCGHINE